MDKYSVSQTPGGKKSVKKKVRAPKHRQTKSTDPKLAVIAIVAVIVALVLGGIVYARFFASSDDSATTAAAEAQKRADEKGEVAPEVFDGVTNAIGNKQLSDLNQYYAKNVRIIIPRSSVNLKVGSGQVGNYVNNPLDAAQTPWNWNVSPQDLAAWQQGPYGENFVGNVIVGISPDGTVIAIHIDENGQIDSIFIAPVGDLTNPSPATPTPASPTPDPVVDTPATPAPFSTEESD